MVSFYPMGISFAASRCINNEIFNLKTSQIRIKRKMKIQK